MNDTIQVTKSKTRKIVKNETTPRKNIYFRLEELKKEKETTIQSIETLYSKLNIILPITNDIGPRPIPFPSCCEVPKNESQLSQEIYCIQQDLLQVNLIFDYILMNIEI
jgi:hypothetical protein